MSFREGLLFWSIWSLMLLRVWALLMRKVEGHVGIHGSAFAAAVLGGGLTPTIVPQSIVPR